MKMNDILSNSSEDGIVEYLTKIHLDQVFSGSFIDACPLAATIAKHYSYPEFAAHLVSSRHFYKHHGIHIGDGRVIHYSGLSDGFDSGPVAEVSISEFCASNGYQIRYHNHPTFSPDEIIARAQSRVDESDYNLLFNNCEHFVNWCIYGIDVSNQIEGHKNVALNTVGMAAQKHPHAAMAVAVSDTSQAIVRYMKGDIGKEKLLEEISSITINTTSILVYGTLGQLLIPIPLVGMIIGGCVGNLVGSSLQQSGHLALGDSPAVRAAKKRHEEINTLCSHLIPAIHKSRDQLERYLENYFAGRKEIFSKCFEQINQSLENMDTDTFIGALEDISEQFGNKIEFDAQDGFDDFMNSDEPFKF